MVKGLCFSGVKVLIKMRTVASCLVFLKQIRVVVGGEGICRNRGDTRINVD